MITGDLRRSADLGDQSQAQQQQQQQSNTNSELTEYTIADVYEDAAVIGSELERIISNYGAHVLKELMPKVINVLELLEQLTLRKERDTEQLNECRLRISSLEMEKMSRFHEREKYEKELEEIEEKWKQETLKLIGMVNKLKEENKRLNDTINQNNLIMKSDHITIKQEELDYIRQIKEENIKLKENIRFKDREIEQKNEDNEALQSQTERLTTTMLNLRRKQILAQNQIEKMVKSKAELECLLTEKEHQLNLIKEKLHIRSLNDDDYDNENSSSSSKKNQLQTSQQPSQSSDTVPPQASVDGRSASPSTSTASETKTGKDLANMLIFDAKDPNRPRFTLKELQKVLMEKNELTIKLDQTQEELEQLRKNKESLQNSGEVQGPINREPEEKLDPTLKQQQSSSGIRRLYVVDSNNLIVVVIEYYFIISSSSSITNTSPTNYQSTTTPNISTSTESKMSSFSSLPPSPPSLPNPPKSDEEEATKKKNELINRLNNDDPLLPKNKPLFSINTFYSCVLLFNLLFISLNMICLPRILIASLVYVLRDKPSFFLFFASILAVLLNDKFKIITTTKKSAKSISRPLSSSIYKRRRGLLYNLNKPPSLSPSSKSRSRLKDSNSTVLVES